MYGEKYQRDVSEIEGKVISMYAKGMTRRDISDHLKDIYGIDASAEMINRITDRVLPEAKAGKTIGNNIHTHVYGCHSLSCPTG